VAALAAANRMVKDVANIIAMKGGASALDKPRLVACVEFGDRQGFTATPVKGQDVVNVVEIGENRRQKAFWGLLE
jgi:hypothetical protein